MKKRKLKIKKKQIIIISCVLLVILLVIILITTSNVKVGKIKNGKALYIDRIVNVTNYKDTNYMDYFAMTCGFKNKKELMKYTKSVIKLANKEK